MKPNLAGLVLLLAAVTAAAPGPVPRALPPTPATVEPTLSLRADLTLEGIVRGGGRARGRLRLRIQAIDEVRDVEIHLAPDPALAVPEAAGLPRAIDRLPSGAAREFELSFEGPDDRDRPLRAEVLFRTADGTLQRLGAGTTLPASSPAPAGRLRAGALEYPAMVLPGPRP
jgi:hypothetical protein